MTRISAPFTLMTMLILVAVAAPAKADHHSEPRKKTRNTDTGEVVTFQFGNVLRKLPFELRVRTDIRPSNLRSFVDQLYLAVPESHLDVIANYYAGDKPAVLREAYTNLYLPEIIRGAGSAWNIRGRRNPIIRGIKCVGEGFSYQVGLQLAFRHLASKYVPGEQITLSLRAEGLAEAEAISRRLFEVCDQDE